MMTSGHFEFPQAAGPKRILVIDAEAPVQKALQVFLTEAGYAVMVAGTGQDGLIKTATWKPDLVILDFWLPDMNGAQVCTELRRWSQIPILVLSQPSSEAMIVQALDSGADDFLPKPFGVQELLARLRAAFRHVPVDAQPSGSTIARGSLSIDLENRVVRRQGIEVKLTRKEFALLTFLMLNPGKVLTYETILKQVWGPDSETQVQYLRVYISRLRKKLGEDFARPRVVKNSAQAGYLFH